jgi:bacterioferritin
MQGNPEVLDVLNEVLTAELTAVNQYFLDGRMLSNWGYERLGKRFYDESIDEMKDADHLIVRILYLEGLPNVQRLGGVRIGEAPVEKLRLALELEAAAIERLNRGIAVCGQAGDNGSRDLLEEILEGEESHADWLESQLALVDAIGEPLYLAQQVRD